MAKLEYKAECLCGGEFRVMFKKPTRLEASVERAHCSKCHSEFMFFTDVDYNEHGRVYVTSHEVLNATEELQLKAKEKMVTV